MTYFIEISTYYRFFSPTQTQEDIQLQINSLEIWDKPAHNFYQSDISKIKAFVGNLPPDKKGIEFTRFEELVREIDLVATIKFSPAYFVKSHQFKLISSYDDLNYLTFASVVLPSGNKVTLLRHQNAPYEGSEIRIDPSLSSPSRILAEAMDFLNLSLNDINWVHPHIKL